MKPKHSFDEHVDGCSQVVTTAHMSEVVRENGLAAGVVAMFGEGVRPAQNRAQNAESSRFQRGAREENIHRLRHAGELLQAAQSRSFATVVECDRSAYCGGNACPARNPDDQYDQKTEKPDP